MLCHTSETVPALAETPISNEDVFADKLKHET